MINITDKTNCCGCTACQQVCPKQCIEMQEDNEGFLYPHANADICINCGLCEKVCPVINRFESAKPQDTYGAKTNDEQLRAESSSGGLFTVIATKIIEQGGVVFGARFGDDWVVVHDYTETIEGLNAFRGSKYVQSRLDNTYSKVKDFLKSGRLVLFTGTPCQVSGLNHFIRRKYDNLYTMDMVCHSISSPKVWKLYLDEVSQKGKITYVTFRDKKTFGWKNYGLRIEGKDTYGKYVYFAHGGHAGAEANIYMRGFLDDLTTRPSCHNCPARNYTSGSDIMIADFWHLDIYHPELDDDKGMSEVILLSDKGRELFNTIKSDIFVSQIPYEEVEDHGLHSPITTSTLPHRYSKEFFSNLKESNISSQILYYLNKNELRNKRIASIKNAGRLIGLQYVKRLCKLLIKK